LSKEAKLWDELRSKGEHLTKYPYSSVISFVFRYSPKDRPRNLVKVLDLGCGIGNHLWFLAREGFDAYGVDFSEVSINKARELLREFGVTAKLALCDFTKELPYDNQFFDLVIDRGSITCVSFSDAERVVSEVYRVLKNGGYFLFTPYSKRHGMYKEIGEEDKGFGMVVYNGYRLGLCFYGEEDILKLLDNSMWDICEMSEAISSDKIKGKVVASWTVIAKKR